MIRLNPQQWPDKAVKQDLFPSDDKYFTQLFANDYRKFLETNATTDDRMQYVATHYGAEAQWKAYPDVSSQDNRAKDYYRLLHIVKTLSDKDYVWISFVEGLHQHAAIVMCLTCLAFDLEDNNIDHGSLKKKDFQLAGVPHYKKPEMSPMEILNAIVNNQFKAPMLMTAFLVQVLLTKHNNVQIDNLMNTLKESSMWISTFKKFSTEKHTSKRLADELTTIREFSTPHQRKKYRPVPEEYFRYQNDMKKDKFDKEC
jgi:hypothetical protein